MKKLYFIIFFMIITSTIYSQDINGEYDFKSFENSGTVSIDEDVIEINRGKSKTILYYEILTKEYINIENIENFKFEKKDIYFLKMSESLYELKILDNIIILIPQFSDKVSEIVILGKKE